VNNIYKQDIFPDGYFQWLMFNFDAASLRDPDRMYDVYFLSNFIIDEALFDLLSGHNYVLTEIIKDRLDEVVTPVLKDSVDFYKEPENQNLNSIENKLDQFHQILTTRGPITRLDEESAIELAREKRLDELITDDYTLRFIAQ
jgi:hypothetical protein